MVLWLLGCIETGVTGDVHPVEPLRPDLDVYPDEVLFQGLDIGDADVQWVTLTSVGDDVLEIEALHLEGASFSYQHDAPASLAPGEELVVEVGWTAEHHTALGELFIQSNAGDVAVPLVGDALWPQLVVGDFDFGVGTPECPIPAEVPIRNVGDTPAELVEVVYTGSAFEFGEVSPITLEPGDEVWVDVVWYPSGGQDLGRIHAREGITDVWTEGVLRGDLLRGEDWFEAREQAKEAVYLHHSQGLFSWDLESASAEYVGAFGTEIWDIAIDDWGQLWGVMSGVGWLYSIDPDTGAASRHVAIDFGGNGLTVLADGTLILAEGDTLYSVDPATGDQDVVAQTTLGISSGDVVQMDGLVYWTLAGDFLAVWDGTSVSRVGAPGVSNLWGLTAPFGELIAFSAMGGAHWLDATTGEETLRVDIGGSWYGATHNPTAGRDAEMTFLLSQVPIPETLEVTVEGAPWSMWLYDEARNAVDADGLSDGDEVLITYVVAQACD